MTKHHLKGFILGAIAMMITPALAIPEEPAHITQSEKHILSEESALFQLQKEDVEAAISHALSERGAGAKIASNITSHSNGAIFSYNKPINVEIRGLRFDAGTHRFSANLVAISGAEVLSAAPVSGRFDELVEVPVLKRTFRAGEVIQSSDVEIRDYPVARTRSDTVTDISGLVGKSPERVISQGRPVRTQELQQAALVKKNDLVKMRYRSRGMEISTNGQAMSDGSKGAVILVRNLASKKDIQATVVDANTVAVSDGYIQTGTISAEAPYEIN